METELFSSNVPIEEELTRDEIIQKLHEDYGCDEDYLICYDTDELRDMLHEAEENEKDHFDLYPNGDEYDEWTKFINNIYRKDWNSL